MLAITLTAPPQCSQVSISMLNTRFNRCAHVIETWGAALAVGALSTTPAAPGRRHLLTPSVVRRKDPVVTREVDPGRRHQRGKPGDKVERLKHDIRGAVTVGCFETVPNIPLRR